MNLFLTKEALYQLSYVGVVAAVPSSSQKPRCPAGVYVERETRFELATSSLEGWSSTN
jgi:hypothetical protein